MFYYTIKKYFQIFDSKTFSLIFSLLLFNYIFISVYITITMTSCLKIKIIVFSEITPLLDC